MKAVAKKKVPRRLHAPLPSLATPHIVLWGTSALGPSASVTREVRGAIAAGNPAPLDRKLATGPRHVKARSVKEDRNSRYPVRGGSVSVGTGVVKPMCRGATSPAGVGIVP